MSDRANSRTRATSSRDDRGLHPLDTGHVYAVRSWRIVADGRHRTKRAWFKSYGRAMARAEWYRSLGRRVEVVHYTIRDETPGPAPGDVERELSVLPAADGQTIRTTIDGRAYPTADPTTEADR